MNNNNNNLLFNLLLLLLLFIIPSESADPAAYSCGNNNASAQISKNINNLLPTLVSGTIQNGFVKSSYGENGAQVYGLAQCRVDVPQDNCTSCIRDAAKTVRDSNHCPNQSDVRIWYDFCFLRYSTNNFFGGVDTTGWYLYNVEYVTGVDGFNETLGDLMHSISKEAVKADRKGLGKGTRKLSSFVTLYGLVQCTRDLSDLSCAQCLARGIDFPTFCVGKKGCRVLFGSCYVRFELYPIFYPLDSEGASLVRRGREHESFVGVKT
ncbi:cysteine-rich repeat secretory protein 55 [Phtheirospermum japonicum]|uniref:Cysteine-rich repeat secretory protein 55 n=1 Tax=Phtheirospermum japonicum TaxID=374723 RepID=A0A830CYJ8_9LAMI|nr:cysteine-rich repeat secretory protein 55 [Phtheirospermum japonicum]